MSKKRVREEESTSGGGGGGSGPAKANQFGQWLLENIYKYARVRDSDNLAKVTKKYDDLSKRFEDLLAYMRASGVHDYYTNLCVECGRTDISESRDTCESCRDAYVSCTECGAEPCASGKHLICLTCAQLKLTCDGRLHHQCTDLYNDDGVE
jgi:hypothetical protein